MRIADIEVILRISKQSGTFRRKKICIVGIYLLSFPFFFTLYLVKRFRHTRICVILIDVPYSNIYTYSQKNTGSSCNLFIHFFQDSPRVPKLTINIGKASKEHDFFKVKHWHSNIKFLFLMLLLFVVQELDRSAREREERRSRKHHKPHKEKHKHKKKKKKKYQSGSDEDSDSESEIECLD